MCTVLPQLCRKSWWTETKRMTIPMRHDIEFIHRPLEDVSMPKNAAHTWWKSCVGSIDFFFSRAFSCSMSPCSITSWSWLRIHKQCNRVGVDIVKKEISDTCHFSRIRDCERFERKAVNVLFVLFISLGTISLKKIHRRHIFVNFLKMKVEPIPHPRLLKLGRGSGLAY